MQVAIEAEDGQFSIYNSNSSNPSSNFVLKKLINKQIDLEKSFSISFNKLKVKKIIFVFNQDTYTRTENTVSESENISRHIHGVTLALKNAKQRNHNVLQDLVLSFFRKKLSINEAKRNQYLYTDYYTYKYPTTDLLSINSGYDNAVLNKGMFEDISGEMIPKNQSYLTRMVESVITHVIGNRFNVINTTFGKDSPSFISSGRISTMAGNGYYPEINTNAQSNSNNRFNEPIIPGLNFNSSASAANVKDKVNSYDYTFSINSIEFYKTSFYEEDFVSNKNQKAIYISKKIPVPGNVLGIKALMQNKDIDLQQTNDIQLLKKNSYELSFSTKENPQNENDWIPIVPYGHTFIDSEVLFFNRTTKTAQLRFYPKSNNINVYEDGKLISKNLFSVNETTRNVVMPTADEDKIYVAEYDINNIQYSQDYIDVSALSDRSSIVSASSSNGTNGEYFDGTGGISTIEITNYPYVNYENFVNPIYSPTRGTINAGSSTNYSPVAIKLIDGSYATNLTNYVLGDFSKTEFYETNEVLFYQNGKNIIFNKPINSGFYVIYNYINNNIRFRAIVRNNYFNFLNFGSLDCVVVKMKINNVDNFASKVLGAR